MLTPQYLDRLPRKLVGLYADLEDAIISDIARRIVKADYLTPTAKWQIYKAKQLRLSNGEIAKLIQQKTGKSRQEIAKLMRTACFDALDPETKLYERAGKKTEQFFRSEQFDRLVKAGIKNTNGLLKNFTRTTAKSADRALERLLDRAYMQMLSGAWSPQEVIAKTVRELADKGIQKIAYPSGHVDQADVAVRRALMTSVNQTSMQLSWAYADEMDCDLVEVTAHGGARPEHAKWQGRIFSRSGKHPVYPDFRKSTGYGTGEGLGGWNCRHSFHAYIEGFPRAYSEEHLKKLDDKTVSYNGKQYTEYEASQKQRKFERDIRGTKRQLAAYDSAIKASADDALTADLQDAFTRQSVKLKSQEAKMRDFLRQTNRLEDSARTQAVGFDKSVSQKAVNSANKHYKDWLHGMGADDAAPQSLAKYYEEKYNHTWEYELLMGYQKAVKKGDISPLVGFKQYISTSKEINNKLVGLTTSTGVKIEAYATHFIDRVIGQVAESHPNKRAGTPVNRVVDALTNPISISEPKKVRMPDGRIDIRQRFIGKDCSVVISLTDHLIIQANPM